MTSQIDASESADSELKACSAHCSWILFAGALLTIPAFNLGLCRTVRLSKQAIEDAIHEYIVHARAQSIAALRAA